MACASRSISASQNCCNGCAGGHYALAALQHARRRTAPRSGRVGRRERVRRARRDRRLVSCGDGRDCRPQRRRIQYPGAPDCRRRQSRPLPQRRRSARWMSVEKAGPHRRRHAHAAADQRARHRRPADRPTDFTLARLLEGRVARLAMGEPGAVPAGVYGARVARARRRVAARSNRRSSRSRRCARCCPRLRRAASMPASSIAPMR